jgi:RNA polymerase sigma factor (sigma-70 family)
VTKAGAPGGACDNAQLVRRLFERHRQMLLAYLIGLLGRRAAAEDVLQETYARLLKAEHLDRDENRARSYAFKIATNLAYDTYRQRMRFRSDASLVDEQTAEVENSPESIFGFEQSLEVIGEVLLGLKPRCRQVFLLRVSEGLDCATFLSKRRRGGRR